jgi:tetratricopeptide (TPR) repeat protein
MRKSAIVLVFCLTAAAACAGRAVPPSASSALKRPFDKALERGVLFLARGEYKKAETEFQAAVEASPDSAKARNYLGLCYFHEKDYEQAKAQFEKATAADPTFGPAYNNLAGIYFVKSKFAESEQLYKKALTLSPDLISANYSLGTLLCNLGRASEGSGYLARGIALDPEYLDKHAEFVTSFSSSSFDLRRTYFAYAQAFAAQGNVEKTVEYLEKAKQAGFSDWGRIVREAEFEKVRDDPRIKIFLKAPQP